MGMVMVGNQKYCGAPCKTSDDCKQSAAAVALSELRTQVGRERGGEREMRSVSTIISIH